MPIYKIYFADDAGTQLYLSSQNGEALQFSNRSERFWAWLGAIPHWVYFTWLRQDTVLWTKTVIWLTALGCLMVIAGIWVTVDVWRKTHRSRHPKFSPYRKDGITGTTSAESFRHLRTDLHLQRHDVSGRHSRMDS